MADVPADKLLSEFTIRDFAGVMLGLLKHYDVNKDATGAGEIGKMSMKDFQELMFNIIDSQRYQYADAEAKITQRIFKDTGGLAAMGTAFRITSQEELDQFCNGNKTLLDGSRELVLVMAIRDGKSGAYNSP